MLLLSTCIFQDLWWNSSKFNAWNSSNQIPVVSRFSRMHILLINMSKKHHVKIINVLREWIYYIMSDPEFKYMIYLLVTRSSQKSVLASSVSRVLKCRRKSLKTSGSEFCKHNCRHVTVKYGNNFDVLWKCSWVLGDVTMESINNRHDWTVLKKVTEHDAFYPKSKKNYMIWYQGKRYWVNDTKKTVTIFMFLWAPRRNYNVN